jgi:hypothetical protein
VTVNCGSFRADESYSPVFVVGADCVGSAGGVEPLGAERRTRGFRGGAGAVVGAVGEGAADAACPVFNRLAASRLTSDTVAAGGPTGGATALPTVIFKASGLPVLSTGATAFAGTA